ncbi:MAG: 3'(2'),5'-bisphosphate nucleotidase CysQ [Microthrixaceae bacterium]
MANDDDHLLAHKLATEAGVMLVELRAKLAAEGAYPGTLKAQGDRAAHVLLMEALAAARPDDAVLSEEGRDNLARLKAERVWIIDPLDGTREFSEVPRSDWAVHVALVEHGEPTAGAVALPALGVTHSTAEPPEILGTPNDPPRLAVSRSRPLMEAMALAEALDADLVPMGSAGAKSMAVAAGLVDCYPHAGGQYEWDSCAPVAVARAAGLWCSRLDGSPLRYNRPDPWLPDLLICHPGVHDRVADTLARLGWG